MSNIKLTYYNGKGRAETARLVLAYAGKEYEDHRIVPGVFEKFYAIWKYIWDGWQFQNF